MQGFTNVCLICTALIQLAARCSGQLLGSSAMGTAIANVGGYGPDATAMGMGGSYGYGPGSMAYGMGSTMPGNSMPSGLGFGSLGNCCGGPPGSYLPMPSGNPIIPGYGQSHPPMMYNPMEPPHGYPMNVGSPYFAPPPPLPGQHMVPGLHPMYPMGVSPSGMGYNNGAMAMGFGSASVGGGGGGGGGSAMGLGNAVGGSGGGGGSASAAGAATAIGYGQGFNFVPPMSAPQPVSMIAQSQQLNENENANTNININNEMGGHHSLMPKGLLGLGRM